MAPDKGRIHLKSSFAQIHSPCPIFQQTLHFTRELLIVRLLNDHKISLGRPRPLQQPMGIEEIHQMPIYEYRCQSCGNEFEALVFGSETPTCSSCDSGDVCKLMSTCGFVSKGAGGETVGASASSSSCGGCSATSCAGCGH
jgi:putative FmdB family regulatory protein